jgi:hypothetical protein
MSRRPDPLHVLCDTPAWRLMLRTLQRLRFSGGRVTSVTTRSIFFCGIKIR